MYVTALLLPSFSAEYKQVSVEHTLTEFSICCENSCTHNY